MRQIEWFSFSCPFILLGCISIGATSKSNCLNGISQFNQIYFHLIWFLVSWTRLRAFFSRLFFLFADAIASAAYRFIADFKLLNSFSTISEEWPMCCASGNDDDGGGIVSFGIVRTTNCIEMTLFSFWLSHRRSAVNWQMNNWITKTTNAEVIFV